MTSVPFPTAEEVAELRRLAASAVPGQVLVLDGSHLVVRKGELPGGHDGDAVAEFEVEEFNDVADSYAEARKRWRAEADLFVTMRNGLPSLLQSASFALNCAEFLQEWRPALLGLARESCAKAVTMREQFVANRFETELADLLRSIPARDEAGRG